MGIPCSNYKPAVMTDFINVLLQ